MQQRSMRIFAVSLLIVLLSATLQSCGLIEIIAGALARVCDGPFEVTKTVDENDSVCLTDDCSLREAVITANDCPGRQVIRVPSGTYVLSLAGVREVDSETGDLNVNDPVTIEAVGGDVVIDADGIDRVFYINASHTDHEDPAIILRGLTIQGGNPRNNSGGGVFIGARTHVTMNGVTVRDNFSGDGTGGGILLNGQLTAADLIVADNHANGDGGGIFVNREGAIVAGSTIDLLRNTSASYSGGGIYNRGEASFSGTVRGNSAGWNGGGVYNGNRMTMTEGVIEENAAMGAGGGVANSGSLLLQGNTVHRNDAEDGGGLYSWRHTRFPSASIVRLVDTTFTENHADNWGGGIFNGEGALLIATRSDLYRNGAGSGGGVFNYGEATFLEANIGGNTASDGPGGGVANRGLITLTRSTLAVNRDVAPAGRLGAAALSTEEGHVELLNSTISGHSSSATVGGVIANVFGSIHGENVTIADNTGPLFGGHSSSFPAIEFRNSIITHGSTACSRPITSLGGNMFDSTDCGMTATDIILAVVGGSAGLDPIGDNGGHTRTHALQSSSPAIDAAAGACPSEDQRGVGRPVGGGCDIGAYESSFALTGEEPDAGDVIELNFNADLYTIERGECTNLRWQVSGADSITLLGVEVDEVGTREVCPRQRTGYELFAQSASEEASSYLEIAVTEPTDDSLVEGCLVNAVCTVPCPAPGQYEVCYK